MKTAERNRDSRREGWCMTIINKLFVVQLAACMVGNDTGYRNQLHRTLQWPSSADVLQQWETACGVWVDPQLKLYYAPRAWGVHYLSTRRGTCSVNSVHHQPHKDTGVVTRFSDIMSDGCKWSADWQHGLFFTDLHFSMYSQANLVWFHETPLDNEDVGARARWGAARYALCVWCVRIYVPPIVMISSESTAKWKGGLYLSEVGHISQLHLTTTTRTPTPTRCTTTNK